MADLHECEIPRLRPTQITVGMIEVEEKRRHLESLGHHERHEFLQTRPIPAVLGPDDRLYITDHQVVTQLEILARLRANKNQSESLALTVSSRRAVRQIMPRCIF